VLSDRYQTPPKHAIYTLKLIQLYSSHLFKYSFLVETIEFEVEYDFTQASAIECLSLYRSWTLLSRPFTKARVNWYVKGGTIRPDEFFADS
jgi:hypothetical protein